MSDYTLTIPEEVYARAREIAAQTSRPVDDVMLEALRTLYDRIPMLPPAEENELAALHHLSDDALWTIARERMADDLQALMQALMDKNSRGTITADEYAELERLVERGQRLMVRKSEAVAILTQHGYRVSPDDLANRG